jgi:type VI secretion system protein ImpH
MLPGGDSLVRLKDWVRNYIGEELVWDVQLILRKEEVPAASLGKSGRLGWSTWTKSKPLPRDADNLILNPSQN